MSWSLSAAPERPGPSSGEEAPRAPWPPRTVAGIPVGLLVCWQVACALVLAMIGRSAAQMAVLAVAAEALLAATTVRRHGRWAYQWAWLWLCYRTRSSRLAGGHASPEIAPLGAVARAATVSEVTVDGAAVAVVEHEGGVTAVLELGIADRPLGRASTLLPSPAALLPPPDGEGPRVTIQLLVQATPAPPAREEDGPAAVSYRQLTEGRVPGGYRACLAVQVLRTPGMLPAELRGAVGSLLRRLLRRLRQDLVAVRPLDLAGLRAMLAALSHLDLAAPPHGAGAIGVERWDAWWAGDTPQASFYLSRWPDLSGTPGAGLVDLLLATECLAVTVSLAALRAGPPAAAGSAGPDEDRVAVQLTARLAAPDAPALAAAAQQLQARLDAVGASADRLDGRQLHGLAATLPLGGFLP